VGGGTNACLVIFFPWAGGSSGIRWVCFLAYKVQMPILRARLFVLLGRFFIILFGDNNARLLHSEPDEAVASVLLYYSSGHYPLCPQNVCDGWREMTGQQIFKVMMPCCRAYYCLVILSGSAVEGEVYALSAFFHCTLFLACWNGNMQMKSRMI